MKVDGGLVVVLFTEAIGHLLDRLNLGVQAITHGTGDSSLEVSDDMGPVRLIIQTTSPPVSTANESSSAFLGVIPNRASRYIIAFQAGPREALRISCPDITRRSGTFNATRATVHGSNYSKRYR